MSDPSAPPPDAPCIWGLVADAELIGTILDGIGDSFYAVDGKWRVTIFNAVAERHFGRRREEVLGTRLWDLLPSAYDSYLARQFRAVMASRMPVIIEADSLLFEKRRVEGRLFPLRDGIGITFRDITERWRAEQALRRREAELARVQEIAHVGGLEVDLRHGFENRRSPEYLRLHGLPPSSVDESHEAWVARIHPDDREAVERQFRETVAGSDTHYRAEYRIIRPLDGEERWICASAEIERDEQGKALRLIGAHMDVTERKQAENRRNLLINELNHRVKNTLATIQAIARQTIRGGGSPAENVAAFEQRLMALSRTHDILSREDWESVDIADLVSETIRPFSGERIERIEAVGPHARLKPGDALALAMALQELSTNAMKYGALSVPSGRVGLEWRISPDGRVADMSWRERDGPPVVKPSRRGFGSRLIEKALPGEFGQSVTLTFAEAGLSCEIRVPISAERS